MLPIIYSRSIKSLLPHKYIFYREGINTNFSYFLLLSFDNSFEYAPKRTPGSKRKESVGNELMKPLKLAVQTPQLLNKRELLSALRITVGE